MIADPERLSHPMVEAYKRQQKQAQEFQARQIEQERQHILIEGARALAGVDQSAMQNGPISAIQQAKEVRGGMAAPGFDPVAKPAHYCRGGLECREVIRAWGLGFHLGNALKYICRADHKQNPIEDLKKAIQNLQFEIEYREAASQPATLGCYQTDPRWGQSHTKGTEDDNRVGWAVPDEFKLDNLKER